MGGYTSHGYTSRVSLCACSAQLGGELIQHPGKCVGKFHIYIPPGRQPPLVYFFLFIFSSFCLFCLSFHLFCLFAFLFVLLFNLSSVRVTALPGLPFRDPTFCRDVRYICIFSQLLHACTIQFFIHIRFEHN